MNEIELKPGQTILSPVGYIHSIVGSHQMHPPSDHPEAKNEAWYIFSAGKDVQGRDLLLYFEPQQTSNTTYSPFDFPTPIEWKNGNVEMRKDIRKGLDALLKKGENAPATDADAIRIMAERALRFDASTPEDFIVSDRAVDITNLGRYSQPVQAHVSSLIEGTYPVWPKELFTLEKISLEGTNASITVNPIQDVYHEIFVIKGYVDVNIDGKITKLQAGSSMFVPAVFKSSYALKTNGSAEVLRVYPPADRAMIAAKETIAAAPKRPDDLVENLENRVADIKTSAHIADLKEYIKSDLPVLAEVFKATLMGILAEHPDKLYFMGIEDDIGESTNQKTQMMPIYKAINEIDALKDNKGNKLFPNLMVNRGSAAGLVATVEKLRGEGRLELNNAFIGARKLSVVGKAFEKIQGEGRVWITAIDDSREGDYLPVFEAITLNMLAYANADLAAIKNFYDAISDAPIDSIVLQEMIKNRIIYILPKMTKFSGKELRELYELAHQVYISA